MEMCTAFTQSITSPAATIQELGQFSLNSWELNVAVFYSIMVV